MTHEAYDREVSSAGFWPGGGGSDYPAFYSYAYPEPMREQINRALLDELASDDWTEVQRRYLGELR